MKTSSASERSASSLNGSGQGVELSSRPRFDPSTIQHSGVKHERDASLAENLRALPRGAWILFLGTFINKFGAFVLPFLAIYMTRLGYSTAQAAFAVGAYGIGTLGASLLGGHLADRLGRRKTIVLSMFSGAATLLCLSQARNLPLIVLFSAAAGLTAELYRPASSALLADLVPAGQRVTAFAAYRMALNAGFAFGPATAGFLAKKSFLWLFVGNAATSVLYGLLAWFALPAGLKAARAGSSLLETFRVLRRDRQFVRVLLASLAIGLVFVQVFSTMSLQITRSGFSPVVYGLVISLNGVLIVLCELPLTTITKRFPARWMMACGFALIGAGFAANAFASTIPLLATTVALFTFGEMIAMPVAAAFVANLAAEHQRGLYMGTYGLTWALAFVGGPTFGLLLFGVSPLALWLSCGALGLLAALIVLRTNDKLPITNYE
jgi:MFS family permease